MFACQYTYYPFAIIKEDKYEKTDFLTNKY